jgi:hypothetical protein
MANTNTNTPIPGSPLIFFFFITLGFLIFTLFSIQSAKSIDDIDKAKDGSMVTIIYVCILIIGSYFINTSVSKALCNSQAIRWTNILLATLLPWIIIFFSLFIILKIFPGWVTPFSNTVGYLVINILGVETTLTDILNDSNDDKDDLAKAIANIKHNKSNFINQIDINKKTFLNFINDLINVGIIKLKDPTAVTAPAASGEAAAPAAAAAAAAVAGAPTAAADNAKAKADKLIALQKNPDIQNLYKLLVIKNVLGVITWYTLAGVLVSSVSYNYIINMSCDKSLEEITKDLNNAEAASLDYAQGGG